MVTLGDKLGSANARISGAPKAGTGVTKSSLVVGWRSCESSADPQQVHQWAVLGCLRKEWESEFLQALCWYFWQEKGK